jgi:hypothetical protein
VKRNQPLTTEMIRKEFVMILAQYKGVPPRTIYDGISVNLNGSSLQALATDQIELCINDLSMMITRADLLMALDEFSERRIRPMASRMFIRETPPEILNYWAA